MKTRSPCVRSSQGAENDELARQHRLDRYHVVAFASAQALQDAAMFLQVGLLEGGLLDLVSIDPIGSVASIPDDDWFLDQYALRNTGQSVAGQSGIPGSDLGVVDAWSWSIGSPDVTVAILDSGVNAHEGVQFPNVAGLECACAGRQHR